jgi:O-antigen/teichoic acid export membrane protein
MTTIPSSEEEKQNEDSGSGEQQGRTITLGLRSLTTQSIGTSILGLVFVSALIRFLPGNEYGIYSGISVTVSISAALATFGLQYAAARYMSMLEEQKSRGLIARRIIFLSTIFSSIVSLAVVGFSQPISLYFTKSVSYAPDFALGSLWLFSSSVSLTCQSVIQGLKKYSLLASILLASRIIMVAFTIIGLYANASISLPIFAWIVYGVIISVWTLMALRRESSSFSPDNVRRDPEEGKHPQSIGYVGILRYSFFLGVASILTVATQNADLVVVGGYLNPSSLGIYNAVITIMSFLNFVLLTPLVTAILPEASSRSDDSRQLSNGLRLSFRFVVLGVLPVTLFVAAVSSQLLLIFSGQSNYLQGSVSLELIAAFYSLRVVQAVIYSVLQALGRTLHVLMIIAASTAVEIGVSLLLVPQVGLLGAAVGRVMAASIGMFVAIYLARELLFVRRKQSQEGFYWKGLISSILPFLVILSLSTLLSHKVWTIVPYSIVGALLFLFCIQKFKVLNNEDRSLIAHVLPTRLRKILSRI